MTSNGNFYGIYNIVSVRVIVYNILYTDGNDREDSVLRPSRIIYIIIIIISFGKCTWNVYNYMYISLLLVLKFHITYYG